MMWRRKVISRPRTGKNRGVGCTDLKGSVLENIKAPHQSSWGFSQQGGRVIHVKIQGGRIH